MGIDRWKQEHRNWRPSGLKLVTPDDDREEPSSPSERARTQKKPPQPTDRPALDDADRNKPKKNRR